MLSAATSLHRICYKEPKCMLTSFRIKGELESDVFYFIVNEVAFIVRNCNKQMLLDTATL